MTKSTKTRYETHLPGSQMVDSLFVGKAALRNRDKKFKEEPIEVFKGIMSNDYSFLTVKDKASRILSKEIPAMVDDYGRVHGNGVRGNFHGLRYVGGFPQRPATFPIADNRKLREDAGLANSFVEKWHENVFEALTELFFEDLEPHKIPLRESASSMMPFFEKKMAAKQELVRFSLANAERAGKLMESGNYEEAWLRYYIGGAYQTVYRQQSADAVSFDKGVFSPKERKVADLDYALTGGRSGTFKPSNRSFGDEIDFRVPEGFFRTRNRTAQGGPLGINSVGMVVAHPVRQAMYSRFAYTFHHTTREAMQTDLRDWKFSIAADVSQHDQFWFTELVNLISRVLRRMGFASWWVSIFEAMQRLPFYVTDVDVNLGNILVGSWLNPDLHGGLSSGNSFTDILGTLLMTGVYFILMVTHTYQRVIPRCQTVEGAKALLAEFLRGKLPIRLKDKSDDALMGWSDETLLPAAEALLEKMKRGESVSPYMVVGYEHGGAFLGNILLYPLSGDFKGMSLIGNVLSAINNQLSPEYGVQSHLRDRTKAKRPFPGLAWETMPTVYGSAPAFGHAMDILEHVWRDVYGESYRSFREKLLMEDKRNLYDYLKQMEAAQKGQVGSDLSEIDIEVLADPEKLQYKYSPDDVSPGVTNLLFKGIPKEEVEPFFKRIVP